MAKGSDAVVLSRPGRHTRLLTLNLPDLRNAMTAEMTRAWDAALDTVAAEEDVRALVVTGAGDAFCAGADFSWLVGGTSEQVTTAALRDRMLPFYRSWLRPRALPFPVVAAVNGPALGAGLCLALACDVRLAGHAARFGMPSAYVGTAGGMGATWLLPEAIGVGRARHMLYTGHEVSPDQALDWGLVTGVGENVLAESLETAERIAAAGPIALRLTKSGLAQAPTSLDVALQWEALAQAATMTTADIHEGIEAMRERRAPVFRGR
ncbi:enoyl-CoA hydratase/isomerase family protein [Yinghuangia sp. ASG 101]|uniref:enoyl-CoA hydratase/isomerase family protein n=1 Tax=Yinghuangia sp. ASG 101 TaxID=2896848 RepID=UPI001E47DFAC|nr:enoyl-CoA hydratase/isomerase family protein [Yinghuangia sp. ASG 101]UGQ12442.1 enoyl-CoA hydratase/isomerase family protein [Yinghuangia sp. ASG 101]